VTITTLMTVSDQRPIRADSLGTVALHDVSVPVRPGMIIYRGNPGVEVERALSIDGGDGANVSRLTMGVHSGTHIDGSLHFFNDGTGVDALPIDAMLGRCEVVEIPDPGDAIDRETLAAAGVPAGTERLVLKTPNSRLWDLEEFTHDFVRLDGSGASWVLEQGIRLVAIDYLSIGDHDAHVELLGNGVVALEGLDLRRIEPGPYELICLPMKLTDTDGAPARALLRDIEPDDQESR
jgi:arylformamidase